MSSSLEVEAVIKWTTVPNIQQSRFFLQVAARAHNIAGDSIRGEEGGAGDEVIS